MSAMRFRHSPPVNEADFELLCLELLRAYWNSPGLDLYAHRGEKQFGVDIIDLSGTEPLSAGQCKLHDSWKGILPSEIKAEVKKAEKFPSKLGRYAILTTAKALREAHDAVLAINQDHSKRDLFRVELITWGKIESLLDRYDNVREEFYETVSGRAVTEMKDKLSAIHEAVVPKIPAPNSVLGERKVPAPIPKADSNRFAIAIAHLDHDDSGEMERLIIESVRDLAGVQILRIDRTISAYGPVPEVGEIEAYNTAVAFLRESSADVLIWGTVLSHDGHTAPRLYWATGGSQKRSRQPYLPERFQLPELFWEDLVEVLRLLVVTQNAELFARRGHHIAAELKPFVDKVRNLLGAGDVSRGWSLGAALQVTFILAMALEQLGEQLGQARYLTESISYYRKVAEHWRAELPIYWAAVQNNLGVALGALGTLESNSTHLLEAVSIFREVLKTAGPHDRASTQNNLGNALTILGERASGIVELREATAAYRAALDEWTRRQFPLDWAAVQNNLGYALQVAGSRLNTNDLLIAAVSAHRNALEEWKRDEVPMYWARAQNNLGNAQKILGERQPGIELLEEAATTYRLALEERAFEREPLAWGEAQNNLGTVLTQIADRNGDQKTLTEAADALRESLKVRTRESAPMAFASSKNNLGYALTRLGEYKDEKTYLDEAVAAFGDALEVWTREGVPSRWSIAQHNLGSALAGLAKRQRDFTILDRAKAAYDLALTERHRDREPILWAATHAGLGSLYYIKGEMEAGTDSLEEAKRHYVLALSEYGPEVVSFERAGLQFDLGNVLRLMGLRKKETALISDALEHHAEACRDSVRYSPYWAFRAADAAAEDMRILEDALDSSTWQKTFAKHGWISELRTKHVGHQIGLKAIFRVVVAGTSGTVKPDFDLAPKKGDRIKDGTVVWENAGRFSYCVQCSEFLAPPEQSGSAPA